MPMKNPSHPGLGVRENLFGPSWAWRYRGGGGSGGGSSYPFEGFGRPRRDFARHGHSAGEGGMVRRGFLAEPPNGLRPGPKEQGSGMEYHHSVFLLVTHKVW